MTDLLRRWDSLTFGRLGQPAVGYFFIALVGHTLAIGVLIGGTIVEPQLWDVYLLAAILTAVVTYALYYVMFGVQWVFRAVDKRLGVSGDSETGDTEPEGES